MKKILAGFALVGTALSAQAADMISAPPAVRYTPAPVMAAVYDWTGFYVGVNAGGGLGRDRTSPTVPAFLFDTTYLSPTGGLGGAQIGFNWQTNSFVGPIVLGVEADIQGAGLRDSRTSLTGVGGFNAFNAQYSDQLDWFGTARGRIGIVTGSALTYITAGYAYGNTRTSVTENFGGTVGSFTTDRMRGGWTYGSGVEAALGGNWTAKIEYLYVDLGNRTEVFTLGVPQSLNTQTRENIYRAGLNYRFGGNGMLAATPAANWTGFYIGGNYGGATARDRSSVTVPAAVASDLFNLSPDGSQYGGQIGYNVQAGSWVFGVEADYQGQSLRDKTTCILTCSTNFVALDARLGSFGTARGRIGYSIGQTLFYATGGYAYGDVRTNITSSIGNFTFNNSRSGYAVGGGIESPFTFFGMLGSNWTTKTEYLYVDLGTSSNVTATTFGPATYTTSVNEHIFRSGINYHFNSVATRY